MSGSAPGRGARARLAALSLALLGGALAGCGTFPDVVDRQDVRYGAPPPVAPIVETASGRLHLTIDRADAYGSHLDVWLHIWPRAGRFGAEEDSPTPPLQVRQRCAGGAFGPWVEVLGSTLPLDGRLVVTVATPDLCPGGQAAAATELELRLPPLCLGADCEHMQLTVGPHAFTPRPPVWPPPPDEPAQ